MPTVFSRDKQYQRKANAFEKILSAMQLPNNIMAGAADAMLRKDNPIEGAAAFIHEHKTWQDVLEGQGLGKNTSVGGGLILDIFTDPTTYLGGPALTKAGKVARAAGVVADISKMEHAAYDASKLVKVVAGEELGTTLAEQAARKQRALITFADKPIVYGEKVYQIAEAIGARVGNTTVGKTMKELFLTAPGVPEAMKLRDRMRRSTISRDIHELEKDIAAKGTTYYREMVEAGVDPKDAKAVLRDAVELNSKYVGKEDLTAHMDETTRLRYVRWTMQAESAKRGLPNDIGRSTGHGRYFGVRTKPGMGATTTVTETGIAREALTATEAEGAVRKFGRRRRLKGVGPADRGMGTSAHVNVLGFPDSWDFAGRMPYELVQHLPENSQKAVRRAEEAAIERWSSKKASSVVSEVLGKYHGQDVGKLHPIVDRAVRFINASNAAYIGAERGAGLKVTELVSDVNYLRHALTPEASDILRLEDKGNAFANSYDVAVKFGAQLQRDEKLRNLTITEINELAQAGQLQILGNRKIKLFEDEPFFATFIRGTESSKAVRSAQMVNDAASAYGIKLTGTLDKPISRASVPAGHQVLSDRLALDMGLRKVDQGLVIEDIALPSDIANMLERHYERVITPAYIQPLLRGYDALQRVWKNTLLPIWPAYHTRNSLSDLMMMTAGADQYGIGINEAIHGISEITQGLAGHGSVIDIGGKVVEWDEFKNMLTHYGMIDFTVGRDLDEGISRAFGLPRDMSGMQKVEDVIQHAGWGNFRPIDFGIRAATFRQNAMNGGYFLSLLRSGHAPEIAALEVKKRLFDFQDLTDVERQIFRRAVPFYSWLRHNLPYQIGAVAAKPSILGNIQKTREAMSGGEGPAGDVPLPGFLAGGMPMQFDVGMNQDPNHPMFVRTQGLLPVGDLSLLDNPMELVANQFSPLLKAPYEVARNTSIFEGQPLERYPGDATKRLGIDVGKRWTPVIDMWRPLKEADNLLKDNPMSSKISGLALAKDYPIDRKLQLRLMNFKLQQAEVEAKKMLYKAAQRGDTTNVVRIRQWLQELHNNPAQLLQ